MIILITFVPLATLVTFNQSMYRVGESDGLVQPVVGISSASVNDITVQVTSTDGTAIGEYCSVLINY